MAVHKYIHWRPDVPAKDGMRAASVHVLVGYNKGTIAAFQNMAGDLRQTFPEASNDEICAGTVRESPFCKNFSIIAWDTHLPEDEYPGWQQTHHGKSPGYSW